MTHITKWLMVLGFVAFSALGLALLARAQEIRPAGPPSHPTAAVAYIRPPEVPDVQIRVMVTDADECLAVMKDFLKQSMPTKRVPDAVALYVSCYIPIPPGLDP